MYRRTLSPESSLELSFLIVKLVTFTDIAFLDFTVLLDEWCAFFSVQTHLGAAEPQMANPVATLAAHSHHGHPTLRVLSRNMGSGKSGSVQHIYFLLGGGGGGGGTRGGWAGFGGWTLLSLISRGRGSGGFGGGGLGLGFFSLIVFSLWENRLTDHG